ncbi:MAG TPA: AAA family ATPase [Flavilitoribacter sp.]|nr:AAA family ATPase [Flavilitoribacter sp.]HMQ87994.1 AAA family ATPase [Flavilitoribacter sp.]
MHKIVFFNNKGGVGKTTTVYNLAHMFAELDYTVLVADFDPQSNLTSMFLDTDRLIETLEDNSGLTILDAITPIAEGAGYQGVHVEKVADKIGLIIGNLALSLYEDKFSDAWLKCLDGDVYAFKVISSFKTILEDAAAKIGADILLVDIGPNLGAINRTALLSVDSVIIPVASDLFSLQGIKNLGKTLVNWRSGWEKRKSAYTKNPQDIPTDIASPRGYIVMQYSAKEKRPVKAYLRFANRIPKVYSEFVLRTHSGAERVDDDPNCLGLLKHYYSLAPMSMEAGKPIFLLKPGDGAIGAHVQAVKKAYQDFLVLTKKIIDVCNIQKNAMTQP